MKEFSLPRRIWRAIYPALLYLLIANGISVIIMFVYAVVYITSADSILNVDMAVQASATFLLENALTISLAGYIATLAVFIPVWLKTRVRYPRWNGGKFSVPAALCSAGTAIGINMLLSIIITVSGVTELFDSYDGVIDLVTGGSLTLQIIAVGLVAPLAEELCFRGVTLSRMSGAKLWVAITVQAVLFGIFHLNILQGVYAALLGVFLGFLTVRFRSVIYAVIAHMAFNLYTVLLGAVTSEAALAAAGIAIIFVTIASVIGLIKCKKPEPYAPPVEENMVLEET